MRSDSVLANSFRVFYEQDIQRWIRNAGDVFATVRAVYVGPTGGRINVYERVGRFILGTLLVLAWIALIVFLQIMALGSILFLWQAVGGKI